MRTLGELLSGIVSEENLRGLRDRPVAGVFDDSRRVERGGLFVAMRGSGVDGRRFVSDAIGRGATAIVGEELPPAADAVVMNVRDARRALAQIAARWYRLEPALRLVGVTGTNGKSTTAFMTRAILRAAGLRCALIGTVHNDLGARSVASQMTTPGPLELSALLRECTDSGAGAAVMEVSSHALDQKRVDGLDFAAAGFTNLTQDHLDYHGSLEAYRDAKTRLFSALSSGATAVVNADDAHCAEIVRDCAARVVRYSLEDDAEVCASIDAESIRGTRYRMRIDGAELVIENAIPGRHNVYNAMAAAGLARALDVPLSAIEEGLRSVRNIPGRLQRVPCVSGADVFVDYAHTEDALRNVVGVLKPMTRRRLIVVFGCGGDRDRSKRPKMAAAVGECADAILVTSDNPRTEDPRAIIDDILPGFDAASRARVAIEPDRRAAIGAALAAAGDGDVVLIAGKGHEDYQIVGTEKTHFDDVEEAISAAAELAATTGG